jgi:hypothetical protein
MLNSHWPEDIFGLIIFKVFMTLKKVEPLRIGVPNGSVSNLLSSSAYPSPDREAVWR